MHLTQKIMRKILQKISEHQAVDEFINHKQRFANLSIDKEAILIASSFVKKKRNITIVKPNLYLAQQLYEKIAQLLESYEEIVFYSQEDSFRVEEIASSSIQQSEKVDAIAQTILSKHRIYITHVGAISRKLPLKKKIISSLLNIEIDMVVEYNELIDGLLKLGYSKTIRVDQPLLYSNRGSIVDVYDVTHDYPLRIEFFDNIIESIRYFDVHTQRTIKTIEKVTIFPATDLLWSESDKREMINFIDKEVKKLPKKIDKHVFSILSLDKEDIENDNYHPRLYCYFAMLKNTASFLDYIEDNQVIFSPYEQAKEAYKKVLEDNVNYLIERFESNYVIDYDELFIDLESQIQQSKALVIPRFETKEHIQFPIFPVDLGAGDYKSKLNYIRDKAMHNTIILCISAPMIPALIETLIAKNMAYTMADNSYKDNQINIIVNELSFGFEVRQENLLIVSEQELFQVKKTTAKHNNRFKEAEVLGTYEELKEMDYIVHKEHGIGRYLGIVNKEINGIKTDYLHISYRDDAKLFIPLEQFQLVRKFVSMEGIVPRLNKLGTSEWQRTKDRVSESVSDIAENLLALYSEREKNIGFAYAKDNEDQKQFEDEFDYELTVDQQIAIDEIKKDMESQKPMDRLLCGDVGFGKTEVAMIAAFKAVNNNKQVAFLCPTTVLSFQHIKTFKKRFKNHAINIEVINRFVLPSKQQKIIRDVKANKVDILIGTHRLLSKDIKFADLGLLIIDEEQRFGVEHKEKIKQIKQHIDVLSLSATPIPRTLQMSLIGLRSLSQLNTPPQNRMPIQTYVVVKNRMLIKEIIERELSRNGQVFYLFNQIDRIYQIANQIQEDIPEASIGVAHGKMDRDEIENVMIRFMNNEYQILVCTTIIETGIDIPNANTMIVDQAENFGLSQLYQIRGRVGRSDRVAYSYLMYPEKKQLSEVATKRLQAIKEFTQLGSGYKIAMRDLTIRGAGDMLGEKQSGFINTVGIDMYIELLKEAIATKKNETIKKPVVEPQPMNLKVEAYIPKSFTEEDISKITIYQEIQRIKTLGALQIYHQEIVDNYGKLPASVEMLFEKKRLEVLLKEERIESFKERVHHIELVFSSDYSQNINGIAFFEAISNISNEIQLKYTKNRIRLHLNKVDEWVVVLNKVLSETKKEIYHENR
jgi:transcription-repair coupling factor (superfamily II helicase)